MENLIEKNYQGYKIVYNEDESQFEASTPEGKFLNAKTLKLLKAKIEDEGKEEKVEQPKQNGLLIRMGYHDKYDFKEVVVNSFGYLKRWSSKYFMVWITEKKGKDRTRLDLDSTYQGVLIEDTKENREIITELQELEKEKDDFETKITQKQEKLKEKLTKVNPLVDLEKLPIWER